MIHIRNKEILFLIENRPFFSIYFILYLFKIYLSLLSDQSSNSDGFNKPPIFDACSFCILDCCCNAVSLSSANR